MDPDRPSVSRSGERPVTRWRREPEPIERPQSSTRPSSGLSRPYSKMERPMSRRGIKNDISEYGISRPPTTGRNAMSRPPSANLMSNRIPTAAPRINTMSSLNLSRANSGLPRNFSSSNSMIMDRPLTQHGLVGLRPTSSRGDPRAIRQIQDNRYYEQTLKFKIQEIKQEIVILNQHIEKHNMEKIEDSPQYDQRSGELAAQLAEFQAQLAEYNMILDKMTSGSERDDAESEPKQLKQLNNEEIQRTPEKSKPEEKISPVKQKAYNLYVKIFEAEQKQNKFIDDKNKLTSEEEKEYLLNKIKQDSLNAAIAEKQREETKTNLENNDIEDKEKDEIMDIFKSTIEKNKADELEKLYYLEEQIIEHLEVILSSVNTNFDNNILDSDEVELLKTLMNQNFENHSDKSFEELRQDNTKLRQFLSKLEALELKIINEINKSNEKGGEQVINNLEVYEIPDKNDETKEMIESDKRTVQRLEAIKRDYSKLKEDIKKNEIYRVINILEDKLERVMFENDSLKKQVEEHRKQDDPSLLIERLTFLTSQYNTVLINDMKTVLY